MTKTFVHIKNQHQHFLLQCIALFNADMQFQAFNEEPNLCYEEKGQQQT